MFFLYIKNATELFIKELNEDQLYFRKIAIEALQKAISAVKPKNLIDKSIKVQNNILTIQSDNYNLNTFNKIYIIGGGKATAEMAFSFERILSRLKNVDYQGVINVPRGSTKPKLLEGSRIEINFASHPIPDRNGVDGTKQMMQIIEKIPLEDLKIY